MFADIQIGYHGIIGIGNRSGVSPGVFRIEEGIIPHGFLQFRVMHTGFFFQPITQMGKAQCLFIMLYRIRRGSHTVSPPVIERAAVYRRI